MIRFKQNRTLEFADLFKRPETAAQMVQLVNIDLKRKMKESNMVEYGKGKYYNVN